MFYRWGHPCPLLFLSFQALPSEHRLAVDVAEMPPSVLHPPPVHVAPLLALVQLELRGVQDPTLALTSNWMLSSNVPPPRGWALTLTLALKSQLVFLNRCVFVCLTGQLALGRFLFVPDLYANRRATRQHDRREHAAGEGEDVTIVCGYTRR